MNTPTTNPQQDAHLQHKRCADAVRVSAQLLAEAQALAQAFDELILNYGLPGCLERQRQDMVEYCECVERLFQDSAQQQTS